MAPGIVGCDRIKFGFEPTSVRLHVALQIRRHDLEGMELIKRREGGSTTPQLLSARPSPTPAARSRKLLSRLLLIDDAERSRRRGPCVRHNLRGNFRRWSRLTEEEALHLVRVSICDDCNLLGRFDTLDHHLHVKLPAEPDDRLHGLGLLKNMATCSPARAELS